MPTTDHTVGWLALGAGLVSLSVFVALLGTMNRLARRWGWVDKPNHRKVHHAPVPLTGGVTIVLACLLPLALFGRYSLATAGLLAGAALVFGVAFLDDRAPIRARYRFGVQVAAAGAAMLAGATFLPHLGELLWAQPLELPLWFALPFTVFAICGVINAVNMTDGADGLAGGLALVALGWFAAVYWRLDAAVPGLGAAEVLVVIGALAGALVGFLGFNLRTPWRARAAIFMGDGGSMMLGFVLAWLAVRAAGSFGPQGMPPVVAVWILAVPLADTVSSMLRRMQDGIMPMSPDHRHVHHLLQSLGLTVGQTACALHAAAALAGLAGVGGWALGVPDYVLFWAWVAVFAAYHAFAVYHWADKPNLLAPEGRQAPKRPPRTPRASRPGHAAGWRGPAEGPGAASAASTSAGAALAAAPRAGAGGTSGDTVTDTRA